MLCQISKFTSRIAYTNFFTVSLLNIAIFTLISVLVLFLLEKLQNYNIHLRLLKRKYTDRSQRDKIFLLIY